MVNLKKTILIFILFLTSLSAYSFNMHNKVDEILTSANLIKLVGTDRVVNLVAQMKDPEKSTKNIEDFDDFVAIAVLKKPSIHTTMTNFDKNQTIIKTVTRDLPWIGVKEYSQSDIPSISLQSGLAAVQSCMAQKQQPIPSAEVSRVIIYKTIRTSEIIYDYSFRVNSLGKGACQEYLYAPIANTCSLGMATACHMSLPQDL